ncbi:protein-glutamine gamma-glutamyltransferase TgpA [Maricurvus nonylphenolicus]|uniref:transglutaminase TgpA family protein n=1 Tax=Maricurvus nonylphenolicus TaxID=1008307 RepID=UPI0036F370ED
MSHYLLPRNSLLWLLGAQTAAIAPLVPHLPAFIWAAWAAVMLWRLQVFRGRWDFPKAPLKVVLVIFFSAALYLNYGNFKGMEPMVALLVSACLLKLLEIRVYRDLLLVVYLSYFLVATQFLFSQSMLTALYGGLCLWMVTATLLVVHQPSGHTAPFRSVRLTGRMLLHCIPLMLLMFIIMPRLGSFWAMPNLQHATKTGVSDSMAPGDFANLTRSGDVAFRVTFEGEPPPTKKLYWRGLVFSDFDGRQWRQADPDDYFDGEVVSWFDKREPGWKGLIENSGEALAYSVIMEPSHQPWLYALPSAVAVEPEIGLARDFRLVKQGNVTQRIQYQVKSYLDYQLEVDPLPQWRLRRELQLPDGFNPQARATAQQWYQESGSPQAYLQRVLGFYNQSFTYTLQPPLLGEHSVDEFLFGSQRGFCEHFSSSFVFMMRAAGIPARVVVGYQGGEYNELENYLIVHQYDAHAWAEVWLEGRGWLRVDPTAAVAPQRIESGLDTALPVAEVFSLQRYRQNPFLNRLRLELDALNYRWHRSVLGYDSQKQAETLRNILGEVTPQRLVMFVALVGGGILLLVALHLYWQRRPQPQDPAINAYRRFTDKLARRQFPRQLGEAPRDYIQRLGESDLVAQKPELLEQAQAITALFEQIYYQDRRVLLGRLKSQVRSFSP